MNYSKRTNLLYYALKPMLSRRFQIWLRRQVIKRKLKYYQNVWPILEEAAKPPVGWEGWPEKKQFAVVLTHDVELARGRQRCRQLLEIEKALGFHSIFNFVPERYDVPSDLRDFIVAQGFEVGVHGLKHDGKLFQSKRIFQTRAGRINQYIKEWDAKGFRSPAMHHNLEWIHELDIEYDMSTFDVDPFEPQDTGVGTIFPFRVAGKGAENSYVEMPYTLVQDFTHFILLRRTNIDYWKQKVDWIAEKGGMVLVIVHPDYICFDGGKPGIEEYPIAYYIELLSYIKTKYKDLYWHALPKEIAQFCQQALRICC